MALKRLLTAAVAILSTAAACGSESDPEPDFVWHGQHLEVRGYGVEQDYFCGGTFGHMDRFMALVDESFGAEVETTLSVGPIEFLLQYCPEGASGCIDDFEPYSVDWALPHNHELVHAVQLDVAKCPVLLAEGLAEYYSWTYRNRGIDRSQISAALDESLAQGVLPGKYYALAGHFVGFLVETYGLEAVLDACDRSGWVPNTEQFETAIEQAFGTPLDTLLAEYQSAYPACNQRDFARKLVECEQDLAATIDYEQALTLDFDIDCSNPQTLGPRTSEGEPEQVWVNHRVRLATGDYEHRIALSAIDDAGLPAPVAVSFLPCARCIDGAEGASTFLYEGETTIPHLRLAPGDYVVEVRLPLAEARRISLTIDSH